MLIDDNISFTTSLFVSFCLFLLSLQQTRQDGDENPKLVIERLLYPEVSVPSWIIFIYISSSLSSCSSVGFTVGGAVCTNPATSPLTFPYEMLDVSFLVVEILVLIVVVMMAGGKYFTLAGRQLKK